MGSYSTTAPFAYVSSACGRGQLTDRSFLVSMMDLSLFIYDSNIESVSLLQQILQKHWMRQGQLCTSVTNLKMVEYHLRQC